MLRYLIVDTAHRLKWETLPPIYHEVVVESAGPSLAAIIVRGCSNLDQQQGSVNQLIVDLCEYIRGRHGIRQPSKSDLSLSKHLLNIFKHLK